MTLTRTGLLEIVRNGESSGVEFKRDDIQNQDFARELVALANLEGGILLLGVEDDGTISGITRPADVLEAWVMNACRDKIRPGMIPFYELIRDVEAGKDVAVVRVSRGLDVHTLWHNNKNSYFIRVGTQSREPSPEELGRLFQQRGNFRAELRPVSGVKFGDLDLRRLKDYFTHVRRQEVPDDEDEGGWATLLFNTEFMVEDGITVSGVLLFGRTPNRFLPQAGIDAAAFPGTTKDYAARERAPLRGPMVPLLNTADEIVESGLVEQALAFIQRNVSIEGGLEGGGARRTEKPAYPLEAVREAIVNALVHRDYLLSSTDIELSIFVDRLEVVSPGRLPNGITPTRMLTGCRASRNQLIKDVMRDYRYLEHSGMGVPRKIVKCMREHNGTEPVLIEDGERFTIRLLR
ncbi:ATP-binding protein [Luteibacter jiangsuensis]